MGPEGGLASKIDVVVNGHALVELSAFHVYPAFVTVMHDREKKQEAI